MLRHMILTLTSNSLLTLMASGGEASQKSRAYPWTLGSSVFVYANTQTLFLSEVPQTARNCGNGIRASRREKCDACQEPSQLSTLRDKWPRLGDSMEPCRRRWKGLSLTLKPM